MEFKNPSPGIFLKAEYLTFHRKILFYLLIMVNKIFLLIKCHYQGGFPCTDYHFQSKGATNSNKHNLNSGVPESI